MRIAVLGASGFIGTKLSHELATAGHEVVAMGRRRHALPDGPGIEAREADAGDASTLSDALRGCEMAYYLVHSMAGDEPFARRDLELARTFAGAANDAGIRRIVYLGALGSATELSEHLSSRQEVGRALGSTGIDVVELRAAVVLGAGSISFEMMRYLVERLPVMVCPRWLRSRISPVAISDVLRYLVGSMDVAAGVYELGAATTTYRDLMQTYAAVRGLRRRAILDVPLLSLRLSAYWVDLVTPVDRRVSHSLISSLANEVVATDPSSTAGAFGFEPMGIEDALRAALDEQASEVGERLADLDTGLEDNVYVARAQRTVDEATVTSVREDLRTIGGDLGWYGIAPAWRMRQAAGRLAGEEAGLVRPLEVTPASRVDWWTVETATEGEIVLRAVRWWPGDGWLGYRAGDGEVAITGAFRPRGLPGFLYWKLLQPVHAWTFRRMLAHRIGRAGVTRAR